jgi:hypothetical protein
MLSGWKVERAGNEESSIELSKVVVIAPALERKSLSSSTVKEAAKTDSALLAPVEWWR